VRIDVISLFPDMFSALDVSMVGRARTAGHLHLAVHNPRAFTTDRHHTVDDTPFGGGAGMVLKPEPIYQCLDHVQALDAERGWVILTGPAGRRLDQAHCRELAEKPRLIVFCGHYEGVDERFAEAAVDEELSIGDYVLTGGELPAMVLVDAVARLLPGVLAPDSLAFESFTGDLLEFPQYTRPRTWRGREVPEVLLSGHHAAIDRWRRQQALLRTARRRPDLLGGRPLTVEEKQWLADAGLDPEEPCSTSAAP
jgi:tRNA (guanine37-N1)-methyltransferase